MRNELYLYTGNHRAVFICIVCCETAGQEAPPQENGDAGPEAEFVARKCDIITIGGRAEKCEQARAALLVGADTPSSVLPFPLPPLTFPSLLVSSRRWCP